MDPKRNDPNQKPPGQNPGGDKPKTNGFLAILIGLLIALAVSGIFNNVQNSQYTEMTWSDFRTEMAAGNLKEVDLYYDRIVYLTAEEAAKPAREQRACYTGLPSGADTLALANELADMGASLRNFSQNQPSARAGDQRLPHRPCNRGSGSGMGTAAGRFFRRGQGRNNPVPGMGGIDYRRYTDQSCLR